MAAAAMSARAHTVLWLAMLAGGVAASIAWIVLPHELSEDEPREAQLEALYPVPLEALSAIEIVARGRLHRFERDAAGAWLYHAHAHGPADASHAHVADPAAAGRIAQAVEMSARTQIERRLPFDATKRPIYGLAYPPLILMLYAEGQPRPMLTVETGDIAPDTVSRYAYLVERGVLVTIPDYQVGNLLALVTAFEAGS
jgi:hypothetical protein